MSSSPGGVPAGATAPLPQGRRLRDLLAGEAPCQLMGAYDGLSARIAVEEGFEVLWASGLCISTARGLRDSNEASWTELLDNVATMVDVSGVPVLVDGDTGHGTFNTARRFSTRAERLGAAGVCFEDKVFPKMNSFFGGNHVLAPVREFCGKLQACKDAQSDPDFVVVARTEALIAGHPLEEALARADAYAQAGADALFVHSCESTPVQIISFMEQWAGRLPVLVSPTTYHTSSLEELANMRIAGVIWANQSMRAAFTAMRDVCRQVRALGGVSEVEGQVVSLKEVFSLLGYHQLQQDEARYAGIPAESEG